MRVSSNRRVIPEATTPAIAIDVLRRLCELGTHQFWADEARLLAMPIDLERLGSHRQVTDVHLVAVAAAHDGRLATFDRGVPQALAPEERSLVELVTSPSIM